MNYSLLDFFAPDNPHSIYINFGHYVMEHPNNTKSHIAPMESIQQLQTTFTDPATSARRNAGISLGYMAY